MTIAPDARTSSFHNVVRNLTIVFNATDGTVTLDGSTSSLTASTNFTSDAIDLGSYGKSIEIYCKSSDVTTGMAASYETSPDGSIWFSGEVSISNFDNNTQIITPSETAIKYIRLKINNTNLSAADVLFCIVAKSI